MRRQRGRNKRGEEFLLKIRVWGNFFFFFVDNNNVKKKKKEGKKTLPSFFFLLSLSKKEEKTPFVLSLNQKIKTSLSQR